MNMIIILCLLFFEPEYKKVQIKEGGTAHIEPQLAIKGIGFDRTLGGLEMDMRLRDHLARAFTVSQSVAYIENHYLH